VIYDRDPISLITQYKLPPYVHNLTHNQLEVYYDPKRFKCVLAGRQSGKSYLDACWLLGGPPGVKSLYAADTIKQAWNIMHSVFNEINFAYNLKLKISKGKGEIEEPNGHIIKVTGIKDHQSADSLRGQKFRRIVIDEGGVFDSDLLKYSIESSLQPTLLKHQGELILTGTPDVDSDKSYFYDLCGDPYSGVQGRWKTFHWTLFDNIHISKDKPIREIIKDILTQNNWTIEHPTFQREYLARWIKDNGAKIFDVEKIKYLPIPDTGFTIIGLDFGVDPCHTAFTVIRMGKQPQVHVIRSFSISSLTPHDIGGILSDLRVQYRPNLIVADTGALGKGYGLELTQQFKIPVHDAKKFGKVANIYSCQGMLNVGNLVFAEGVCEELIREWNKLVWNPDKKGFHKKYKADCCLVAGTKISTPSGLKNIEDLIIGDEVYTENGINKISAHGCTNPYSEIYELTMSDGNILRGTSNHPVYVKNKGFVNMDALVYGDELCQQFIIKDIHFPKQKTEGICPQEKFMGKNSTYIDLFMNLCMVQYPKIILSNLKMGIKKISKQIISFLKNLSFLKKLNMMGSSGLDIHIRPIETIESISQIVKNLMGKGECCINLFGKSLMDKFQKICTYITKIITHSIMISQIWCASLLKNMPFTILLKENSQKKCLKMLLNGIDLQKGEKQIKNQLKNNGKINKQKLINANNAEIYSQDILTQQNGVNQAVPKKIYVIDVKKLLQRQPTWNLTVENDHHYYANGILVHNSDSLLYALTYMLQTHPYTPPVDIRDQNIIEMEKARTRARNFASKGRAQY